MKIQSGQSLVEYVLILSLLAIVAIVVLSSLGIRARCPFIYVVTVVASTVNPNGDPQTFLDLGTTMNGVGCAPCDPAGDRYPVYDPGSQTIQCYH